MDTKEIKELSSAIRSLGFGEGLTGPGAIEALAMAIAGEGLKLPLSTAVADVAEQIGRVADALEDIADVLKQAR
jgi:hypothetical protein